MSHAFPDRRDGTEAVPEPMRSGVQATAHRPPVTKRHDLNLLLRHCLAFDETELRRPPARVRLEEALGPDLARRLVTSLTAVDRR